MSYLDPEVSIRRKELMALLAERDRLAGFGRRNLARSRRTFTNGASVRPMEDLADGFVSDAARALRLQQVKRAIPTARRALDAAVESAKKREEHRRKVEAEERALAAGRAR